MAKVDFSAAVTGDGAAAASYVGPLPKDGILPPRHNLYAVNAAGKREYVDTERADTFEDACKLAEKNHPGITFTATPPVDRAKLKKRKWSMRKNIFVMQDGNPVYFTTEHAMTHAEAKAQAQKKHPGVTLLCEDDF